MSATKKKHVEFEVEELSEEDYENNLPLVKEPANNNKIKEEIKNL